MGWLIFGAVVVLLIAWAEWKKVRDKRLFAAMQEVEAIDQANAKHRQATSEASSTVLADAKGERLLYLEDGHTITVGAPNYELRYIDGGGEITSRKVVLLTMGATPTHFQAYCFLRDAERTFSFDKVLHLADLDTGEIIPTGALWSRFHSGKLPPLQFVHEASARVSDALVCFARDHLGAVTAIYRPIILNAMRDAAPADNRPDEEALLTILNRRSRTNNVYRAADRLAANERLLCLHAARTLAFKGRRQPNREAISYAEALFVEVPSEE